MAQAKVSIIIPTYNVATYVEKCIKSVLCQTMKDIQVVIVDDGSTDGTVDIIEKSILNDKRVVFCRNSHSGVSKARNIGIGKSNGEYLFFVDSDDWIDHKLCDKLYSVAKKENCDVVFCASKWFGDNGCIARINHAVDQFEAPLDFILKNELLSTHCKLVKRDIIQHLFDERIGVAEDLLFWVENLSGVSKYAFVDEPLYNYRVRGGSLSRKKTINKNTVSELLARRKVISLVSGDLRLIEKIRFIRRYLIVSMYDGDKKIVKDKYGKFAKAMYRDVLLDSRVSLLKKIKFFLLWHLPFLYRLKEGKQ